MQICDRGNWVDDMVSFQKVYCRARTQRQCTSLRTSDTCKVFLTTQNEPNEVTAVRGLGYHGIRDISLLWRTTVSVRMSALPPAGSRKVVSVMRCMYAMVPERSRSVVSARVYMSCIYKRVVVGQKAVMRRRERERSGSRGRCEVKILVERLGCGCLTRIVRHTHRLPSSGPYFTTQLAVNRTARAVCLQRHACGCTSRSPEVNCGTILLRRSFPPFFMR